MYTLNDTFQNVIFTFEHGGKILDRDGRIIGHVRNGVVCDKQGNPTRAKVDGANIDFNGPDLTVSGDKVLQFDGGDEQAVIVGATTQAQRMIAAAAYWEFSWSLT
jgi:hypothetical protein